MQPKNKKVMTNLKAKCKRNIIMIGSIRTLLVHHIAMLKEEIIKNQEPLLNHQEILKRKITIEPHRESTEKVDNLTIEKIIEIQSMIMKIQWPTKEMVEIVIMTQVSLMI